MTPKTLLVYRTVTDKEPFNGWLDGIDDVKTRARILARLDRLEQGQYGDVKPLSTIYAILRGLGYRLVLAPRDGQPA